MTLGHFKVKAKSNPIYTCVHIHVSWVCIPNFKILHYHKVFMFQVILRKVQKIHMWSKVTMDSKRSKVADVLAMPGSPNFTHFRCTTSNFQAIGHYELSAQTLHILLASQQPVFTAFRSTAFCFRVTSHFETGWCLALLDSEELNMSLGQNGRLYLPLLHMKSHCNFTYDMYEVKNL